MKPGKLYLIPTPIAEESFGATIIKSNIDFVNAIEFFIVENAKEARRFLKACNYPDIQNAKLELLNEHNKEVPIEYLIKPLLEGSNMGLMSDAGCPGVADPGARVVEVAHKNNIEVIPLVGPSSILLSVMSSGFNGQSFAFVGYLPIDGVKRKASVTDLEKISRKCNQSQFFIETPYRNIKLLEELLSVLNPDTLLFVGAGITGRNAIIKSMKVREWKISKMPEINKVPTVFGIYCQR
ncbi:MAG: SAM-dependent methyltransferase [Bacteroidia bacterium]